MGFWDSLFKGDETVIEVGTATDHNVVSVPTRKASKVINELRQAGAVHENARTSKDQVCYNSSRVVDEHEDDEDSDGGV